MTLPTKRADRPAPLMRDGGDDDAFARFDRLVAQHTPAPTTTAPTTPPPPPPLRVCGHDGTCARLILTGELFCSRGHARPADGVSNG